MADDTDFGYRQAIITITPVVYDITSWNSQKYKPARSVHRLFDRLVDMLALHPARHFW